MAKTTTISRAMLRTHIRKMRQLVNDIENAPLNEVATAIEKLKAELDTLMILMSE
jgi:hypothetical protein